MIAEAKTAGRGTPTKQIIKIEEQDYFPESGPGQAVSKDTSENPSHQHLSKEYLSYVDIGQQKKAAHPVATTGTFREGDEQQVEGKAAPFKALETPLPEVVTDVRLTMTNHTHAHTSTSQDHLGLMDLSSKEHLVMLGPDGEDSQSPEQRPVKPDFKPGCQTMLRASRKSSEASEGSVKAKTQDLRGSKKPVSLGGWQRDALQYAVQLPFQKAPRPST